MGWGLTVVAPPAYAPDADLVFAGSCKDMSLAVTFSPALTHEGPPAAQTTITVDGSGECLMQDGEFHDGTLTGTANSPGVHNVTCAGGVVAGFADFYTDYDGFDEGVSNVSMHIFLKAGIASVVVTDALDDDMPFAAVGVFVQVPTDTHGCVASDLGSTTWCGAFAFGAKGDLVVPVG